MVLARFRDASSVPDRSSDVGIENLHGDAAIVAAEPSHTIGMCGTAKPFGVS